MSGSIAGSRALDDRRRRRLAVTGDGASEPGDAGALSVLRERQLDLPAASPWLPRQGWRFWLIAGLFWTGLTGAAVLLIEPVPPHPQIAPAIEHLVGGARPVLATYADIVLWTLAAQMAVLVGWYRSHSQLDFRGRYRLWSWPVLVFGTWGFCAGTSIHTAIGLAAGPHLRWPVWRAETVVWLVPAMATGLSVWWVIRNDLQRCRVSHTLIHLAISVLLLTGVGLLYQPELSTYAWGHGALVAGQFAGMGLLVTGLWWHAWYVTYICADPPDPTDPMDWRGSILALASTLLSWLMWPFRRRTADSAKPRKRKNDDEESAPKRRRKSTAKAKRKPRTRVKANEEESTDEDEEANDEDESASEEDWSEEDEEAAAPPKPMPTLARSTPPMSSRPSIATPARPSPPPTSANSSWSDADEDEDESDDDDAQYRDDGAHGGVDPFKGLSKRQRRELKRQMRDQQRQQQSRGR